MPAANQEGGRGTAGYLIEFSGNKFSTSGVDSFHDYHLKDKKQNRADMREVRNELF